ncbi:hypothetical protein [Saccharothrix sp. ALI-22-I]|uniref:hypothetical protein n=1 Tax=Saccharothrix sp. ALI-22-I TaxID=1933778 RepID=UPI00097C253F|nr:hypothetical protein [Saccharothrix sp. ALI-22-I]
MARRKRIELRPDLEHQWHYQLNPDGSKTLQVRPDLGLELAIDLANNMFEDDEERCCDRYTEASSPAAPHDCAENAALTDGPEHPDIVKPRAPRLQWTDA